MAVTNFKDIFDVGSIAAGTNLTIAQIFQSLLITLLISMFIYWLYKKTYQGVLYSKNFNMTLVLVSMITAVIMMAISGNLALSLGMVGALSIIRFRTAIKDPKDIAFLFWAISLGIINGIAFYKLSIISSLLIGGVLLFFSKKVSFSDSYILIINYSGDLDRRILGLLKYASKKIHLRNKSLSQDGTEAVFELQFKKNFNHALLNELNGMAGVSRVLIFSNKGDLVE